MSKKRFTIWLSPPLALKFERVAARAKGGKSGMVEDSLKAALEPELLPGVGTTWARHLEDVSRSNSRLERDVAIVSETLGMFVRYFLTVVPPMPQSDQEGARTMGRERFEVFIVEVGRRMMSDRRLIAEVLETIAVADPDLFGTLSSSGAPADPKTDAAPAKSNGASANPAKSNGASAKPKGDSDE
jgi:hypothetical protein